MSRSSLPAFCGCSATRGQRKNTLLVKYEAVHMTDCRFPRPFPKNKTLSAVCCLTRKDFHFQVCTLHFPEERIPHPAGTAIPRDGFVCANLQTLVVPEARGWAPYLPVPHTPLLRACQRDFAVFFLPQTQAWLLNTACRLLSLEKVVPVAPSAHPTAELSRSRSFWLLAALL